MPATSEDWDSVNEELAHKGLKVAEVKSLGASELAIEIATTS
jgi:hypothetical protein